MSLLDTLKGKATVIAVSIAGALVLSNAITGGMLLSANQKIGKAKEQCNTRVAEAAAARESAVRTALDAAHEQELERLQGIAMRESAARIAAQQASAAANAKAANAQATIERLREATNSDDATDDEKCGAAFVRDDVRDDIDRMRD